MIQGHSVHPEAWYVACVLVYVEEGGRGESANKMKKVEEEE
jgi:hypothetical protein